MVYLDEGGVCMIQVLFVCLGNICRSPMAEAIFRHKVQEEGLADNIHVDSAGTSNWHIGDGPHAGTCQILDQNKIAYTGMVSRQVQKEDLAQFDYILAMDASNLLNLEQLKDENQLVMLAKLLDFLPESQISDVPDPYFTGDFNEVYDLIDASCTQLLAHIRQQEKL